MAKRKYKRNKNGQFASTNGGAASSKSSGTKRSSSKGAVSAKRKQAAPGGQTFRQKAAKSNKSIGKNLKKFAKDNPGLVTTAVMYGGAHAAFGVQAAVMRGRTGMATKLINNARTAAYKMASDKRGIGGRGAGLKKRRRNLRGAYNIRST